MFNTIKNMSIRLKMVGIAIFGILSLYVSFHSFIISISILN